MMLSLSCAGLSCSEHSNHLFGPSDYKLQEIGAEVVEADSYGDPGPTGRSWHQRDWEYDVEGEEDYDE